MAYKNPLTGSGGSVTIDTVALDHVTNIELDETGSDPEYSSSDTNGEIRVAPGCDRVVLTTTSLLNNDETALPVTRGTIYTVVAKSSATLTIADDDFLASEVKVSTPIKECDFVVLTIVFKSAEKDS